MGFYEENWVAYDPTPDLLRASVAVTRRMQRLALPTATRAPMKRIAPPGRLVGRQAVQAAGLRSAGNVRAAMRVEQFQGVTVDRVNRPPAVVGIMSDVSGSMRWSTTAVGEAAWLLARGAAHAGARVASVVFGEGVDPVVFPGEVPQRILVRAASDGTESPDTALAALDGGLALSSPTIRGVTVSRVVVILSDTLWRPERIRAFSARARALAVSGVQFIVLGPSGGGYYAQVTETGVDPIILNVLGGVIPIPPHMRDRTHPQFDSSPQTYRNWAAEHPEATSFARQDARPLTPMEVHAHPGNSPRLDPMIVIPRTMLENHGRGLPGSGPGWVRDQIVEYTLSSLEARG